MTSWREDLTELIKQNGESWDDVLMVNGDIDTPFDHSYGGAEGTYFCLWTEQRVYFPAVYDGYEWVECVRRHPTEGYVKDHVGGQ